MLHSRRIFALLLVAVLCAALCGCSLADGLSDSVEAFLRQTVSESPSAEPAAKPSAAEEASRSAAPSSETQAPAPAEAKPAKELPKPEIPPAPEPTSAFPAPVEGKWTSAAGAACVFPAGFSLTDITSGYLNDRLYTFYNSALDMTILLKEWPAPKSQLDRDYAAYQAAIDLPTYQVKKTGWFAISGYLNNGATIFYAKESNPADRMCFCFEISYPYANREVCNGLVTLFEKDFKANPS